MQVMIEIHLYGILREMVPGSRVDEDTILCLDFREGEDFRQLIGRLGLKMSDIGDCFINGTVVRQSEYMRDGDRVGLFPYNMRLIDGGMELKYSPHRR